MAMHAVMGRVGVIMMIKNCKDILVCDESDLRASNKLSIATRSSRVLKINQQWEHNSTREAPHEIAF
jgi:hypothetical protein